MLLHSSEVTFQDKVENITPMGMNQVKIKSNIVAAKNYCVVKSRGRSFTEHDFFSRNVS